MTSLWAAGTLALISETSWALQWLIGALPAGWVWTRHVGSPLRGWHLETKKQHSFDILLYLYSVLCVSSEDFLKLMVIFLPRWPGLSPWPFSPLYFTLVAVTAHVAPLSARILTSCSWRLLQQWKKKSEVIEYIRWNASSELHLFLITGFHLSYHIR